MSARILVSIIACSAVLSACGQRGALYLPEAGRNVVVTPAQPVESSAPAASPVPAASPATTAPADTAEEQRRKNATAPAK
jgi:predicted small lipoprotein YifL